MALLTGSTGRRIRGVRRDACVLQHGGSESFRAHEDEIARLVHTRPSILEVGGERQPLANEDDGLGLSAWFIDDIFVVTKIFVVAKKGADAWKRPNGA